METHRMDSSGQTSVFDSGARARSSNPSTSKAAAASVQNMRASHKRVLAMFRAYGDMTDETLAEYLNEASKETGLKLMSPSGVRSRRSELSKPNMDRIEQIADRLTQQRLDDKTAKWAAMYDEDAKRDILRAARAELLVEGVKSPLWDTGKREALSSGRQAIVWGLAR
jgi:hypothetical protein